MLKEEGYRLMAAAFEVYNQLGYGMAEEIYQQSLEIELRIQGIPFDSKYKLTAFQLTAFYKEFPLDTKYVPDLLVFGSIVVELNAVGVLAPEHEAQLFNYLRIVRQPVGYLFNFGHKGSLEWKRFIVTDLHKPKGLQN